MAVREVVRLHNQDVTNFEMHLFIRPDAVTDGALLVTLSEQFLDTLLLPGCRVTSLWTKRPVENAMLNMGEFSAARWSAAAKKLRAGTYNVVQLIAQDPARPAHQIMFGAHVNTAASEYPVPIIGRVDLHCRLSYLREVVETPTGVEALLRLGRTGWNGTDGAAYGFANIAFFEKIVAFNPNGPQDPDYALPWNRAGAVRDQRPHPIPVAYVGLNVDHNLEHAYCSGRGIKGAFWANFLSQIYVEKAGGMEHLRESLPKCRIEPLRGDGLLVVATESPLPEDTEENRVRFIALHRRLQPAFIARAEMAEGTRGLLSYFYRERASIVP